MSAAATVNEFIRLIAGGEFAAACQMVTSDVEYDNVPVGKNIGPEAMTSFLETMSDGVDEIEFVILRQTAFGNIVMNERIDRFRIGEKWIELPVAGVFEVTGDGLISLWRDYFDMATMTDQVTQLALS